MSKFTEDYGYQAYCILMLAFVVAPILAGIDKFYNILAYWPGYLSPFAMQMVKGHAQTFMMAVGVIEVIAGIGTFFKPQVFAYVVALWLLGIIINLLMTGHFYDIALRDLGLMLGALALARLSQKYAAAR